jgi:hypothetical protein
MITKINGCNRQIMPQSFATCKHSATKVKGKHSTDLLQKKIAHWQYDTSISFTPFILEFHVLLIKSKMKGRSTYLKIPLLESTNTNEQQKTE